VSGAARRDRDNAATGTVTLVRRDPFASMAAGARPHAGAARLSLWDPVPLGVDELGQTVSLSLPERNVLLGGEPGAGKSAALSLIVASAALDPSCRLWLLDGKLVELSAWAPCAHRLAGPDLDEAIGLLKDVRSEMDERYRTLLARGARIDHPRRRAAAAPGGLRRACLLSHRREPQAARGLRGSLPGSGGPGRAAGVIVCAATQKPASNVVPSALRDLFGFRLALRCNTPQASDTILGQGWASLDHSAATIRAG
jgi:DNA segregation ATPase FtsK/SpoIIIE-like protein